MPLTFHEYEKRLLVKRPDLILVHFDGINKPVKVLCARHGLVTISQGGNALLSKYVCPRCGNEAGAKQRDSVPPKTPITLTDDQIAANLPAPFVFLRVAGTNPRRVYFLCPVHGEQSRLVYYADRGCARCGKARRGRPAKEREAH